MKLIHSGRLKKLHKFLYIVFTKRERNEELKVHKVFKISLDISEKDWDDVEGQVQDAIIFLKKYQMELQTLFKTHKVSNAYLDFPIYSRLQGDIANQNDQLPSELILLAAKLSLGIEMAIYSKDAFNRDVEVE